jgi:cytoskeletal protein CcmA (bactofilin family)
MDDRASNPAGPVPTVLGRDATFEGVLSFRGDVRVEGRLRGEVYAVGGLRVEAGASIEGRVEVDDLIVAGSVRGEVIARRRLELLPTARVEASVRTTNLALSDGCVLQGRCEAGPTVSPQPPSRKTPAAP